MCDSLIGQTGGIYENVNLTFWLLKAERRVPLQETYESSLKTGPEQPVYGSNWLSL